MLHRPFPAPFRRLRTCLALLLASGLLYSAFLWPVPRFLASGIPYFSFTRGEVVSFLKIQGDAPRNLVPGDHLQLLYHFNLFHGMCHDEIPWLQNPYEFNFGPRDPPRRLDPYYAPFAFPYTLLRLAGTEAFAWNATQFLSVLLGTAFLFFLARRLGEGRLGDLGALSCAALAESVPYLWTSLSGGSPTGFAMSLLPGVALGVDLAVFDRRPVGGALAGLCLLASYMSDLHCAYFAMLSLPFWVLLSLARMPEGKKAAWTWKSLRALVPAFPALALELAFGAVSKGGLPGSAMENGPSLEQVARHSPVLASLFNPFYPHAFSFQFHIGVVLSLVWALGSLVLLRRRRRPGILLAVASVLVLSMALGTNGPFGGALLKAARAIIPKYRFIRQPLKVFCLLPALVACISSLSAAALLERRKPWPPSRGSFSVSCGLALLAIASVVLLARPMHAGVCLLPETSSAYRAAVQDAEANGRRPKALMLPVLPGGALQAAVYQHAALHNRLRMVNGYAPAYPLEYETVYKTFRPIQRGGKITRRQLRALRKYGVTCVILDGNIWGDFAKDASFEDIREELDQDPHFRFLGQADGIWAYAVQ